MSFNKPILRVVTDLSVTAKLSVVSGHIFYVFIEKFLAAIIQLHLLRVQFFGTV